MQISEQKKQRLPDKHKKTSQCQHLMVSQTIARLILDSFQRQKTNPAPLRLR